MWSGWIQKDASATDYSDINELAEEDDKDRFYQHAVTFAANINKDKTSGVLSMVKRLHWLVYLNLFSKAVSLQTVSFQGNVLEFSSCESLRVSRTYNALINVIPGGRGAGGGGGFDKAFMPEGVAFDFMDSTQGADI